MSAIEWHGIDEAGFRYGYYSERSSIYRVGIAIPDLMRPRKGSYFKVLIEGREVGQKADLNTAMIFAESFFARGLHRAMKPPSWYRAAAS